MGANRGVFVETHIFMVPDGQAAGALGGGGDNNELLDLTFAVEQLDGPDPDVTEPVVACKTEDNSGRSFQLPDGVLRQPAGGSS